MSIKVGLLGFGGMAKGHFNAYKELEAEENSNIKLVAICDINPDQFTSAQQININTGKSKFDLSGINLYTDVFEMLAAEELDMIDVCLPTFLHAEFATAMLNAGKNVICEKPMALSSKDCQKMIDAAKTNGKKLMIAQCLRFEPLYTCLKDFIDSGELGGIRYMFFDRLSTLPLWGFQRWYRDDKRSGGCALDLHVHDVDMIRFLVGEPQSVSAVAKNETCRWQLMNSRFNYPDIPVVVATGSWMEAGPRGFRMSYRVGFDKAEVILENNEVMIYPTDKTLNNGVTYKLELPKKNRLAEEIRYFVSTLVDDSIVNDVNSPESAMATVALVEKLRMSADEGGTIIKL